MSCISGLVFDEGSYRNVKAAEIHIGCTPDGNNRIWQRRNGLYD